MDADVFIPPDPEISRHYEHTLWYRKSDVTELKTRGTALQTKITSNI